MLYGLDVCHGDDFNTCFQRVTRPQLINNMVLFSANGTNSSILIRGDDFASYLELSELVPMFSTRLSALYVSTIFLLPVKNFFHLENSVINVNKVCSYLFKKRKALFVVLIVAFKYSETLQNFGGFLWAVFSRISTGSTILSLYGKMRVRENPYSSIFYAVLILLWNCHEIFLGWSISSDTAYFNLRTIDLSMIFMNLRSIYDRTYCENSLCLTFVPPEIIKTYAFLMISGGIKVN